MKKNITHVLLDESQIMDLICEKNDLVRENASMNINYVEEDHRTPGSYIIQVRAKQINHDNTKKCIMPKTKYVEIKIENRLPESEGYYLAKLPDEGQVMVAYFFNPEDEDDVLWWKNNVEYWLEEVQDYEEEMKEILEDLNHVKDDILQALDHANNSAEDYQYLFDKAENLLTKLKQQS
ncbi:hypothetical protein [Chryseobacterium indologenes]|uniref:hypothetical protein n=1 Tax=Chryseobacterium indologenes TaxID=253 RepID=UPI001F4A20F4|nr:hypothetical protein [Chryseobacterium indologenes]